MKRIVKGFVIFSSVGILLLLGLLAAYSHTRGGAEDIQRLKEALTLYLFRYGVVESLTPEETQRLYQQKCYRRCHGEAAMITAILPPSGWMQIVERMRVQEGVVISGREADEIIRFLELKYPVHRSSVPYSVRREINRLLWKNDVGYGDLYVDVIYGTPVYFDSINARSLAEDYGAAEKIVFIVSMTVHEGRVKNYPLEKMAYLKVDGRKYLPSEDWRRRIETADGHHREGVLIFSRKDPSGRDLLGPDARDMELVLQNLESSTDRIYSWKLPIPYPKEFSNASN